MAEWRDNPWRRNLDRHVKGRTRTPQTTGWWRCGVLSTSSGFYFVATTFLPVWIFCAAGAANSSCPDHKSCRHWSPRLVIYELIRSIWDPVSRAMTMRDFEWFRMSAAWGAVWSTPLLLALHTDITGSTVDSPGGLLWAVDDSPRCANSFFTLLTEVEAHE